ncbi:MAG: RnfABCDGE type electron transport complex subunit D [Deltaproteobacteria bacterium]|nr:RnfABCDGE type electron transport complex subunit D [Deltaproteobacteria bacterium]MBW2015596.1 RnfABCDGE type electron transport complex subunit D [Deltaproteobacteria bacterium]MBW2128094.1 RnfABCDGE type electron transport complex subunit D [Deltaproteobacteria bacterium]MBW2303005.1 RnfABCDGE type electron transport complex subunit D [Deltaproteobacteria bacterium]
MASQKLFVGSYAPHWHDGSSLRERHLHIMLACLPAVILGIAQYGIPAFRVVLFSVSCAMLWELLMNKAMSRPVTIGDGNAALIGMVFAMLLPATTPWWMVVVGTFVAIVIGKQIWGGMGCNPCNPVLVAVAILMLSWHDRLDFNAALVNYDFGFTVEHPLTALKYLGPSVVDNYNFSDLFLGQQVGGIGTAFALGLILGGVYLILRGFVRWEISLSFLLGLVITASIFHGANPEKYAGPLFHVLTGYTLIATFFLLPEESSSPVNFVPMLLYGAMAGVLTVLIRNIGFFVDGVVFAVLLVNLANPLLDRIRPKAMGREIEHA